MKIRSALLDLALLVGILVTGTNAAQTPLEAGDGPRAFVPSPEYKFALVLEGTDVLHDFMIQNRGNAPLKIITVKTG